MELYIHLSIHIQGARRTTFLTLYEMDRFDLTIPYFSAIAADNPFVDTVVPEGYFEITCALVVSTIDLRSSLKQDDRKCGAAAKNKILSAKI